MRAMSPSRKIALVEDANRTARRLALAGIQLRCPDASDEERSRLLIELFLGEELAGQAFGPRGPARGRAGGEPRCPLPQPLGQSENPYKRSTIEPLRLVAFSNDEGYG